MIIAVQVTLLTVTNVAQRITAITVKEIIFTAMSRTIIKLIITRVMIINNESKDKVDNLLEYLVL